MLRTLRMIAGVLLVILGLAALFTPPLTPGSWFALIGLELMGFGFLIPKKVRKFWKKSPIPGLSVILRPRPDMLSLCTASEGIRERIGFRG